VDVVVDVAERRELLEHVVRVVRAADAGRSRPPGRWSVWRRKARSSRLNLDGSVGAVRDDPPDLEARRGWIGSTRREASFVVSRSRRAVGDVRDDRRSGGAAS
jgi:hypothetical protein